MLKSDFKSNAFAKMLYNTSKDVICGSTLNLRHSGGKVPSHFYGFKKILKVLTYKIDTLINKRNGISCGLPKYNSLPIVYVLYSV